MKTVGCQLVVTAYIECPYAECGCVFDLFEREELTDGGYIHRAVFGETLGCKDFGEVTCPFCGKRFLVGEIAW